MTKRKAVYSRNSSKEPYGKKIKHGSLLHEDLHQELNCKNASLEFKEKLKKELEKDVQNIEINSRGPKYNKIVKRIKQFMFVKTSKENATDRKNRRTLSIMNRICPIGKVLVYLKIFY